MATTVKQAFQTGYYMWETPKAENNEPSATLQSMAEDVDINIIMKRFGLTGQMPENPRVPNWGVDYTEAPRDYRTALQRINEAQEAFMEIPADIRYKFQNDPGTWMDWVNNPENAEEARRLGFAKPKIPAIEPPPATPVAAPPQGGTKGGGTSST